MPASRVILGLLAAAAAAVVYGARAQEPVEAGPPSAVGLPASDVDDEIIVRGSPRGRQSLRLEIELAEEAFFARFNEINSSDDFDIVCRLERPIGSKIARRECVPNFWRELDARLAQDVVATMQGSFGTQDMQGASDERREKQQLLAEEVRRLARDDPDLLEAAQRLAAATERYEESRRRDGDEE